MVLTSNNDKCSRTFIRTNSFQHDYDEGKYQYIFTNPPYGGNSNTKQGELNKLKKIKNELETKHIDKKWATLQLTKIKKREKEIKDEAIREGVNYDTCSRDLFHFAKKFGEDKKGCPLIPANDKEACSLLLLMKLVAINGTVAGVLKEGVFFDSKYALLRKALIENYNVEQIISILSDAFENTSTKTSIIIFKNNGRTKKIIFSDLVVNKYTEDVFEILESDGNMEIKLVHDRDAIKEDDGVKKVYVGEAIFDDIVNMKVKGKCPYSLNAKKYNRSIVSCSERYKMVRLGELCEIKYGDRITKKNDGVLDSYKGIKYPVYGGGDITFYTKNTPNRKGKNIVISRFGISNSCVRIIEGDIFLNDSSLSVHTTDANTEVFIGAYLLNNTNIIFNCGNASAQKNLDIELFKMIQIPIPRTQTLLDQWIGRISTPYNAIQQKKQKLVALEELVKMEVQRIGNEERCDMVALGELCEYIKTGKHLDKKHREGTKYPYYGTTKIMAYTDIESNIMDGDHLLMARKGDFNIMIVNESFCANDDVIIIKSKIISSRYLYEVIKVTSNIIKNMSNGSTVKGINMTDLKTVKIPIPRNAPLIRNLEKDFKKISTQQQEIKDSETEYNRVLQELSDDIKLETTTDAPTPDKSDGADDEQDTPTQSDILEILDESDRKKPLKKKNCVKKKDTLDNDELDISDDESDRKKPLKKKNGTHAVKRMDEPYNDQDTETVELDAENKMARKILHHKVKSIVKSKDDKPKTRVVLKNSRKTTVIRKDNRKTAIVKRKD